MIKLFVNRIIVSKDYDNAIQQLQNKTFLIRNFFTIEYSNSPVSHHLKMCAIQHLIPSERFHAPQKIALIYISSSKRRNSNHMISSKLSIADQPYGIQSGIRFPKGSSLDGKMTRRVSGLAITHQPEEFEFYRSKYNLSAQEKHRGGKEAAVYIAYQPGLKAVMRAKLYIAQQTQESIGSRVR